MEKTRALRNAAMSVLQTKENYDYDESAIDTLEVLFSLLFEAEREEQKGCETQ